MPDGERAERTKRLAAAATALPPPQWFLDQLQRAGRPSAVAASVARTPARQRAGCRAGRVEPAPSADRPRSAPATQAGADDPAGPSTTRSARPASSVTSALPLHTSRPGTPVRAELLDGGEGGQVAEVVARVEDRLRRRLRVRTRRGPRPCPCPAGAAPGPCGPVRRSGRAGRRARRAARAAPRRRPAGRRRGGCGRRPPGPSPRSRCPARRRCRRGTRAVRRGRRRRRGAGRGR